ncbi:MAG: bifunctional nuclease family protein [Bradymonadales bacterium]|nr:bifunctional nuclease family protein [Bradymonadales bacterium]
MRIVSLLIDPNTGLPVVVLMELEGRRAIPIVIGVAEAEAIALGLQNMVPARPRTHDLMKELVSALGGEVEQVVIHDLKDSTFYANLYVRRGKTTLEIDARPSDAMALATRTGARIFMEEAVLEAARMKAPEDTEETTEEEPSPDSSQQYIAITSDASSEELKEILEKLDPDDFGKYKM